MNLNMEVNYRVSLRKGISRSGTGLNPVRHMIWNTIEER